jgi:hypothetical protein
VKVVDHQRAESSTIIRPMVSTRMVGVRVPIDNVVEPKVPRVSSHVTSRLLTCAPVRVRSKVALFPAASGQAVISLQFRDARASTAHNGALAFSLSDL